MYRNKMAKLRELTLNQKDARHSGILAQQYDFSLC